MTEVETNEINRIRFVYERNKSLEELVMFCHQGFSQYRNALHTPYGRAYKESLEESIEVYRRILYMNLGGHHNMILKEIGYETP